jgi:chromosomal replication initiation ATPase DnaA
VGNANLNQRASQEPVDPQEFWDLILNDLALQMTRDTFTAWLQPTRGVGLANGMLSVQVPNQRIKEWLENRLAGKIHKTADFFSDKPLEIRFVVSRSYG